MLHIFGKCQQTKIIAFIPICQPKICNLVTENKNYVNNATLLHKNVQKLTFINMHPFRKIKITK